MDSKALYDFLFQLYDYADYLADRIEPGNYDNVNYFLSLVYIEQMMDRYGRGLIVAAAREIQEQSIDSDAALGEAHRRIDALRQRIRSLVQMYDFDQDLRGAGETMLRDWHKTSS